MNNTDEQLEDELRALLDRVLSTQLNGLTAQVQKLSDSVSTLTKSCIELPRLPKKITELVEEELEQQFEVQTKYLNSNITKVGDISTQQSEQLIQVLTESNAGLSTKIHGARLNIVAMCEALQVQFKLQSETQVHELNSAIAAAQEAAMQRNEKLSESLSSTVSIVSQSIDKKNAALQIRITELERKTGFMQILCVATLGILILILCIAVILYISGSVAHH
ncbi:hypothetical protein [Gluconobacter kanchanaburiensis]|uniref:Uncharacterized protein n=1 Tax=Gluconobacter kanchanaburiensis NBRC 103587 TaxID=1307948 RepID=A0A511BB82_9PROT|nr:hypothetical protein [Gluconobacter kanchanaburiensis]MBF0862781.1 hypothetical protein [Gluconobacter kanchanaburiensis]GBR68483.1 hypothetical protein AA103587_0828 [Gluconobacter kanchanaburiensis NBRC 103587]GEK97061.1 hypothetical protein GKA01_22580 [Gluconobacter kanchanaburiensis NBRC 103587]